ncbi:hexose transporter-like protein [Microdochium nivale]|nr:hexose transporter-like protein [Microdochium nivale]
MNPMGPEVMQWRFYLVYVAILVIECLFIYFCFVETRGPTLEEIAVLFDGPGAPASVAQATAEAKLQDAERSVTVHKENE